MKCYLALLIFILSSSAQAAGDFPAKARLFAGNTWAENETLNQEMQTQGLKEFGVLGKFGVEITFEWNFLEVGLAYMKRGIENDETISETSTLYTARLDQDIFIGVVRLPLIKSSFFRADVFGGAGGSSATLKVVNASQNGELKNGSFSAPFLTYGASAGLGYKGFYFYIEGGFDSCKVESLTRTGTISNAVQSINASGAYGAFGLMFDVMAFNKK